MKLFIISITKDDPEGLERTITSTHKLRNRYKGQFIHLIVDGSIPEIASINKTKCDEGDGIYYEWTEPNGISSAFNFGISKSVEADWVWFLNGGDEVHEGVNVELLNLMLESSSADIMIFQTEYKQSGVVRNFPPIWLVWPLISNWVPHPSVIVRRSAFVNNIRFKDDLKYVMDYSLWWELFSHNLQINLISIPIACFDENGISSLAFQKVARESLMVLVCNIPTYVKIKFIRWKLLLNDVIRYLK